MTPVGSAAARESAEPLDLWRQGRIFRSSRGAPEVLFAQVREGAAVEAAALAAQGSAHAAVFCVASGGCTALSLLASPVAELHAVDVNPAQIHLVALKETAFEELSYDEMLRCTNADARPYYPTLRARIDGEARNFWDRRQPALSRGLNHCGAVERRLERFRAIFRVLIHGRKTVDALFRQDDLEVQRRLYRTTWDSWRWSKAFELGLSKPFMALLYDRSFVEGIPAEFSRLMKERVDRSFVDFPLRENGYLWQLFLGCYPPGQDGLPIHLKEANHGTIRERLGRLHLCAADAASWLEQRPPRSLDFFALSNILEVTSPEHSRRCLEAVLGAARPGALVCLRAIFSHRDEMLRAARGRLELDRELSTKLEALDPSPFCSSIRILRVHE